MAVQAVCAVNDQALVMRSSLALQVYYLQGMFSDLHIISHSFLNPRQFLSASQSGYQDRVQCSVNHIAAAPQRATPAPPSALKSLFSVHLSTAPTCSATIAWLAHVFSAPSTTSPEQISALLHWKIQCC